MPRILQQGPWSPQDSPQFGSPLSTISLRLSASLALPLLSQTRRWTHSCLRSRFSSSLVCQVVQLGATETLSIVHCQMRKPCEAPELQCPGGHRRRAHWHLLGTLRNLETAVAILPQAWLDAGPVGWKKKILPRGKGTPPWASSVPRQNTDNASDELLRALTSL